MRSDSGSPHFEASEDGPVLQLIEYPDGVLRVAGVVDPQDMPLAVRVLTMNPWKFYWPQEVRASAFAPCQKAITKKIKETDDPPESQGPPDEEPSARMGRVGSL